MAANQSGTAAPPPEDRKRVHRMIEATIPAPLLRAASRLLPDGVKRAVNATIASGAGGPPSFLPPAPLEAVTEL